MTPSKEVNQRPQTVDRRQATSPPPPSPSLPLRRTQATRDEMQVCLERTTVVEYIDSTLLNYLLNPTLQVKKVARIWWSDDTRD